MIQVKSYNDGLIKFYCDECKIKSEQDVSELLVANSVLDIEVVCPSCKDIYILYILKCSDEALMRSLNAEFISLKERRRKELED